MWYMQVFITFFNKPLGLSMAVSFLYCPRYLIDSATFYILYWVVDCEIYYCQVTDYLNLNVRSGILKLAIQGANVVM